MQRHLLYVTIIPLLRDFNERDLYHLLEKVGSPSGDGDLGNTYLKPFFIFQSRGSQVLIFKFSILIIV